MMKTFAQLLAVAALTTSSSSQNGADEHAVFHDAVRLLADGEPIDIGKLSKYAHAGPCVADADGDGDRDLVVGDFPGAFWFFENTGTDKKPVYAKGVPFKAGDKQAKTPVY